MSKHSVTKSRLTKALAMFASVPLGAMPLAAQTRTTIRVRERLGSLRETIDPQVTDTKIRSTAKVSLREGLNLGRTAIRATIKK